MRRRVLLLCSPFLLASVLLAVSCSIQNPSSGHSSAEAKSQAAGRVVPQSPHIQAAGGFASLADHGDLVRYPTRQQVRHEGASNWYRADISEAHALRAIITGRMTLTAPNGQAIPLRYQRHVEHANGNWTWIGRDARGEEAIITFGERAVFGSIPREGADELRLSTMGGHSWVVEIIPGKQHYPRGSKPDYLVPPAAAAALMGDTQAQPSIQSMAATAASATAATTVDVALGYTTGFASELGGDSQAVTRLQHLVDVTNQAYAGSQIDAQIRLVRTVPVGYADATDNNDTLKKLTGSTGSSSFPVDPAFNGLRAARDQYGADLVALVRRFRTPENDGCGVAWILGGGQTRIDASDAPFGYSVVSDDLDKGDLDEGDRKTYVCRKETLAHELGHNMGQAHNVEDGDSGGAHTYSYGYREASTTGFYTIMAYRLANSSQKAIRYFANPNVMEPETGRVTGTVNTSDNARSMTQTMPIIALFRSTIVPGDPPPAPAVRTLSDVNADGRADLMWHNTGTGQLYYWAMNGGSIVGGGGTYLPLGYASLAVGDFNGDDRADVVISNGGDVRVIFATSAGGFGAPVTITGFPGGWILAGAGDVNADGKTDLIWRNAGTGELYYWVMNGSAIAGGRGGAYLPAGYTARVVGDFNGDGRADLVISNGGDLRLVAAGSDGSFGTPVSITGYPGGWTLVGAGDVNGDGKTDLVWQNSGTSQLYYWAMNGQAIVGGGGKTLPAGYTALAVGDSTGDGRADVVISNGNDLRLIPTTSSGSFGVSVAITGYPAGWTLL